MKWGILTLAQLRDKALAGSIAMESRDGAWDIQSKCHPFAPQRVRFVPAIDALVLNCAHCGQRVAIVAVGNIGPGPRTTTALSTSVNEGMSP